MELIKGYEGKRKQMIENLMVTSGSVNWNFNNKEISIEIENAFFASEIKETNLIKIDCGKNFIESKVYYYNFEGNLELSYNLYTFTIEWFFRDVKKRLVIANINQVEFFLQYKRFFVLSGSEEQKIYGYRIDGKQLFEVNAPEGFKMLYFTRIKEQVVIVCDGDKEQKDAFGRYRYNFFLNIDSGKLTKGDLAY